MTSSVGPRDTAPAPVADPFRGVSHVELPRRCSNTRERVLAETACPRWPKLTECAPWCLPVQPAPLSVGDRRAIGLTKALVAIFLLPTVVTTAIALGTAANSLLASDFVVAGLFAIAGSALSAGLAKILHWIATD